jgi:hypothetical protein
LPPRLGVAARVARRELDVDDHPVLPVVRVDLAIGGSDDAFVLADARPGVAAEGRRLRQGRVNLDAGDARLGYRRSEGGGERRHQGELRDVHLLSPLPLRRS